MLPKNRCQNGLVCLSLVDSFLAFCWQEFLSYGYSNKGIMEGLRFGLLTGLLVWIPIFCIYVTFRPYPKALDIGEPVAGVIQFLFYGIVLSLIYKPASEKAAS